MLKQFPVVLGQESVGMVEVRKNGLYYDIQAQCKLSGEVPCRLIASAGGQTLNLGILVPQDECFRIHTRVARKRLSNGDLSFHIGTRNEPTDRIMYPLSPEEPFRYLERLTEGFLHIVGDKMYFTDPAAD